MDTNERLKNELSLREKVLLLFGVLMSLVYLSIGIACIVIPSFLADYNKIIKMGIGIAFVAYSLFRLYRSYQRYKSRYE
jgi:hypothetical protein